MTAQMQTQKKAPAASAAVHQSFQPRAFPALQAKEDESLTEQPSLHTQLDRAEQFGHSLGNVQTNAAPQAIQAQGAANMGDTGALIGGALGDLAGVFGPILMQLAPMLLGMI